jgi:hypothetical protein
LACLGTTKCCRVPCRYYLSNQDAYRLKLLLPLSEAQQAKLLQQEADAFAQQGQQLQQLPPAQQQTLVQ